VWTDGGTGSSTCQVTAPTWVYRLADGSYTTVFPDGSETASVERPRTPEGHDIALSWYRLVGRLPLGPATDELVADLESAGGAPDRDLLWRLVAALGGHEDAPSMLFAEGVRVECSRGWVGSHTRPRCVTVKVTYFL
jgi:hypothetical protein